tara:strand:- start:1003 stop:1464 length:462 start_codon:yes stop_codon:yes gene_type:complete
MATIATLRKSGNVESNSAYKGFPEGQMFIRKAVITTPVLALNDVIQAIDAFKGETLHALRVVSTDIDTNGSPAIVLDIGHTNTDTDTTGTSTAIKDGSTIAQGGGIELYSALSADDDAIEPIEFSADTTIDIHVQVAPATGAAGTITVIGYFS